MRQKKPFSIFAIFACLLLFGGVVFAQQSQNPSNPGANQQNQPSTEPNTQDQQNQPGYPQNPSAAPPSSQTPSGETEAQNVLSQIHSTNQAEIQAAQLAEQKATDPKVKSYARQLVDDHKKADQELQSLAQQQNIQLVTPTPENQLQTKAMQDQQTELQRLQNLSGSQFDQSFVKFNQNGHRMNIQILQDAQNKIQNPAVKQYVSNLIPTLQEHESHANQLMQQGAQR